MKDRKNSSLLRRLEKFQRLFFVALLSVLAVGASAPNLSRTVGSSCKQYYSATKNISDR
ncbi:hypothetical protein M099_4008 [Phocaeicola vulgatus str. 3975 RP4]|uniref:Uncharacterized protein n=1 Tax=Phocaeicola vulgatus str. 3975 RP4 TaxID=1339352 RepID=A0A069S6W3_PHOVU|nr:hypothetical protein [Phocaeicola vulgatus]KDS45312.1 hypothetical protein M099_4008 [Phocaeicola vulgatus str. 3975 RP4]